MQRNTLKSFQWSFLTAILRKIILFGVFLLIAQAISKEDLGIFREFSLVIAIFAGFSFVGFKDLLIVKKENTKALFQQLILLSVVVSGIALIALYGFAPMIGRFYKSEVLAHLLRVLSPLICIEIIRLAIQGYYHKMLKFKLLSIIETINVIIYSALIIIFFYVKLDIKTLTIIFYFGNLIELIMLISFERELMGETFRKLFSLKLAKEFIATYKTNSRFLITATSNNLIALLGNDIPVIVLGTLFNPVAIGIYYLANQLVGQPVVLACNSLRQVLFPTFTFMSRAEMRSRINQFYHLVTLAVYPLFFLFVIYVLNFAPLVLGDKWNEALPIVAILAFPLATTMLINPISSLPYVLELPHLEIFYMLASLIFKSVAIFLGHYSGFETAIIYYAVSSIILHLGFIALVSKITDDKVFRTLFKLILKFIPSLVLVALYILLSSFNPYLRVALFTSLVGIYLLISYKTKFIRL